MNQLPTKHQKVFITKKGESEPTIFDDATTMISGDHLIITIFGGRDEEKRIKKTVNNIIPLDSVKSFETYTHYYGEEDKEILKD